MYIIVLVMCIILNLVGIDLGWHKSMNEAFKIIFYQSIAFGIGIFCHKIQKG